MASTQRRIDPIRVSADCDCQCFLLLLSSGDGDAVLNPERHLAATDVRDVPEENDQTDQSNFIRRRA